MHRIIPAICILFILNSCTKSGDPHSVPKSNRHDKEIHNKKNEPTNVIPTSTSSPTTESDWRTFWLANGMTNQHLSTDLFAVHNSPILTGESFSPVDLIRSINYFVSVGRERCKRALLEYAKLCREPSASDHAFVGLDDDRVVVLGFALFRMQSIARTPIGMWVVGANWMGSIDVEKWPDFPFSISGDIPFLLARGYRSSGLSLDAHSWFLSYEPKLEFRTIPLEPTISPKLAAELVHLKAQDNWLNGGLTDSHSLNHFNRYLKIQVEMCLPENHKGKRALIWSKPSQKFVVNQ